MPLARKRLYLAGRRLVAAPRRPFRSLAVLILLDEAKGTCVIVNSYALRTARHCPARGRPLRDFAFWRRQCEASEVPRSKGHRFLPLVAS
jgi:hypothetical protein